MTIAQRTDFARQYTIDTDGVLDLGGNGFTDSAVIEVRDPAAEARALFARGGVLAELGRREKDS